MKVEIYIPDGLHPETQRLVQDFATAIAQKLRVSERKYGWADDWRVDDWEEKCRADLREHLAKGDPRDVAIYCAFMWRRNWSTIGVLPPPTPRRYLTIED